MDKIFLRELKVETIIGIWEWERKIRQTVIDGSRNERGYRQGRRDG